MLLKKYQRFVLWMVKMNDEIKEILDNLRHYSFCFDNYDLEKTWVNKLLDYITNLQTIEQQYGAILSENVELENKITNLQEENEKLLKICGDYDKQANNYKSRIEKAVEYIKRNYKVLLLTNPPREAFNKDYLLNILNGDEDE